MKEQIGSSTDVRSIFIDLYWYYYTARVYLMVKVSLDAE